MAWLNLEARRGLKPLFLAGDISGDEFRVGLGQIDDAFDQADETHKTIADTTGKRRRAKTHDQHDDARGRIAEVELVDAESAQQNRQYARHDFLFRAWNLFRHISSSFKLNCRVRSKATGLGRKEKYFRQN